jgi:hypothetical protein
MEAMLKIKKLDIAQLRRAYADSIVRWGLLAAGARVA